MSGLRKITCVLLAVTMFLTMTPGVSLASGLMLPSSLKKIEASAFENDTSLGEVVLPEGIESIGARAFADASVTRIRLPGSLKTIAEDAFQGASVGIFEADRNTYAWQWLDDHGYLLHFSEGSTGYDATVDMGIFQSDPEKGLGDDWFAAWYELAEYEDLKGSAGSEPVWNVTQTSGPAAEYLLQHYDGQASLSVAMPDAPAVYRFTLDCSWEGRSVSTGITVRYKEPDSLPTGTDIPGEIELTMDQENVFSFHFVPEDFSFGRNDRIGFENYTGTADVWYEGHDLHIIPHDEGTFTGDVVLYAGNLYIARKVTFRVNAIPEQILNQIAGLVNEETGRISMDALTPISTDGVTDPYDLDRITAFNDALPKLRTNAEAYNAAMDDLFTQVTEMTAMLGNMNVEGTSSGFSLTSDVFSFSCGEGVQEMLESSPEVVSAELTGDAVLLTLRRGEQTGTLRISQTGISLAGSSARSNRNASAVVFAKANAGSETAANAAGEFADSLLEFLTVVDEALQKFSRFDNILDMGAAAWESAGALCENLAPFISNALDGVLLDMMQAFGLEEDCRHFSSDFLHAAEIYRKYEHILSVRGHVHPTEMEAADAVMMSAVTDLRAQIPIAIASYAADMFLTLGDMALTVADLIKDASDFGEAWKPNAVSLAKKGLNLVKSTALQFAQVRFRDDYEKLCEIDEELHYEFSGIVWDQDNKPLQGVRVTLGSNTIYTDAMGMFEMESAYSTAAPIFYLEGYKDKGAPHRISLTPYEKKMLSVRMTKDEDGGSVEGYVFDAETLEPISGASLSYQGKTAISASGGYYRIDAPYRKADTLTAEASGYAPWRISVAAPGTGEVNKIDVPMRRICQWTISGTVYGKTYDHKTGDWVETPLAGATVAWGPATVTTQADGTYEIGVEEGTLQELSTLTFSLDPAYEPQTLDAPHLVTGILYEGFNCTLPVRYGSLKVEAVPEHSREPNAFVQRAGGGIKVRIGDIAEDLSAGFISYLPVGTYDVTVDGAEVNLDKYNETVTIEEGKTTTLKAVLPWLIGVKGRIVNEDGSPVADAEIWVYAFTQDPERAGKTKIYTDTDGRFFLFNSNPEKGGEFVLKGNFVSMDYRSKDKLQFQLKKGTLQEETWQVRCTEGKYVRSVMINVCLSATETSVTRGLIADLTWDGRSLHLEGDYEICPTVYLPAADENVSLTLNAASIGIDGVLYSRSPLTESIAEFNDRIGFAVSTENNEDWH